MCLAFFSLIICRLKSWHFHCWSFGRLSFIWKMLFRSRPVVFSASHILSLHFQIKASILTFARFSNHRKLRCDGHYKERNDGFQDDEFHGRRKLHQTHWIEWPNWIVEKILYIYPLSSHANDLEIRHFERKLHFLCNVVCFQFLKQSMRKGNQTDQNNLVTSVL